MLKNMKIGKKLILTFISVAILSSIGGILGLVVMTNMNSTYDKALDNYGFSQGDIGLYTTEFNNVRVIMGNLIIDNDPKQIQTDSDELTKSYAKLDVYFANLKKRLVTDQDQKYYNDISTNQSKFKAVADQEVALAKQNNNTAAYALLTEQATPIANTIRTSAEALMNEKSTVGTKLSNTLSSQAVMVTIIILAVILISLTFSLIIALKISRSISKPVEEMADAAQRMSKGDLNVKINVTSKDEIGQLGTAFSETIETIKTYITDLSGSLSKMANGDLCITRSVEYKGDFIALADSVHGIVISFNDALTQINQASEQVLSGSGQVSNGAQALAQGTTEQASSIEELSATISDIATHVKDNAQHAAKASVNVNHVSSEIEISNKYMGEMIAAISQINDSSRQIGKIIKTIEDIAFQTNILALNAAVEAARAGAAGKGFAVVADEVRNLASKSAEAAKDTTALIENSMNQVENGTKIADQTAKSLLRVVESAKAVSDDVERISQASNRQSDAIGQVTLGVDQISSVVQTNSATAEESAAASEELSGQAQALKELVSKFKLTNQIDEDQNVQSEPQQEDPQNIVSNSKY